MLRYDFDKLADKLRIACKFVNTTRFSIYGLVAMKVESDKTTIYAKNNIIYKTVINEEQDISEPISLFLSPALIDIMLSQKAKEITIDVKDGEYVIEVGSTKLKARNLDKDVNDMGFDDYILDNEIKVRTKENLTDTIKKLATIASNDDSKPSICGINIHSNGHKLEFCTTDIKRLAYTALNYECAEFDVIIPIQSALCIESDFDVTENYIKIYSAGDEITSPLIKGQFPKYDKLLKGLPADKPFEIKTDAELKALRNISKLEKNVIATFKVKDNVETINCSAESGIDLLYKQDVQASDFEFKVIANNLAEILSFKKVNYLYPCKEVGTPIYITGKKEKLNIIYIVITIKD